MNPDDYLISLRLVGSQIGNLLHRVALMEIGLNRVDVGYTQSSCCVVLELFLAMVFSLTVYCVNQVVPDTVTLIQA